MEWGATMYRSLEEWLINTGAVCLGILMGIIILAVGLAPVIMASHYDNGRFLLLYIPLISLVLTLSYD